MIAGFIVSGKSNKKLVFRGLGPSLANFGITGLLSDPVLSLYGSDGSLLATNDNWKDDQRNAFEHTLFEPGDDRESALLVTLPPAAYTVALSGKFNTSGVALIEVYDNNLAVDSQLANVSTRGLVQGGNNVMVGGFILGNSSNSARIALRGLGPSLGQFGIANALGDPTLELHDANGVTIAANDNWNDDPASAAELAANGLALPNPNESGIFLTLPAGQFTVVLAGKDGGTGIGLVEIYNLN